MKNRRWRGPDRSPQGWEPERFLALTSDFRWEPHPVGTTQSFKELGPATPVGRGTGVSPPLQQSSSHFPERSRQSFKFS